MEFKGTPFHQHSSTASATRWWYAWDGYLVPDMFSDVEEELRAIRNSVAMIDMSPLPKAEISGPDATALVNRLITRSVSKMEIGQAYYTPLCAADGNVVCDGLLLRTGHDKYILSTDSAVEWSTENAQGHDVTIRDLTDEYGVLSLQGPNSTKVLENATGEAWAKFKFSRIRRTTIAGAAVDVARQGFTGELGYELWVHRDDGEAVYTAVKTAGREFGIRPAGEYAADIARVEAGIILVRADYTGAGPSLPFAHGVLDAANVVTPRALGLERLVDYSKADFIGKAALESERLKNAAAQTFTGLTFDIAELFALYQRENLSPNVAPRVRWTPMRLMGNDKVIGRATSVTWSPTLKKMIGFGCIDGDFANSEGKIIKAEWRDESGNAVGLVNARQIPTPFITLRRSA